MENEHHTSPAHHASHEPHHAAIEVPRPEHHTSRARNDDSLNIPIAIVFAGVLIAGSIIFTNKNTLAAPSLAAVAPAGVQDAAAVGANVAVDLLAPKADDHILGNPNADVLIVEYSDTECPFCKQFHQTMLQVMDKYGKNGQVAWVYRYFPLDMHPKSRREAQGLECASQLGGSDAFWKYTDKIFEVTPANNGLDEAMVPKIAGMIGLDVAKFTACVDSGKNAERVQRDFEGGANVGVRGTPYSIIWNRITGKQTPVNGAYPLANLTQMIDQALAAK